MKVSCVDEIQRTRKYTLVFWWLDNITHWPTHSKSRDINQAGGWVLLRIYEVTNTFFPSPPSEFFHYQQAFSWILPHELSLPGRFVLYSGRGRGCTCYSLLNFACLMLSIVTTTPLPPFLGIYRLGWRRLATTLQHRRLITSARQPRAPFFFLFLLILLSITAGDRGIDRLSGVEHLYAAQGVLPHHVTSTVRHARGRS